MIEPEPKEISDWQKKLEYPDFRNRALAFQDFMYKFCEDYRKQVGVRYIRVVLKRHDVKSLESVVNKIARNRQDNPNYDFKDIEDLIGIKILCPYLSSAKIVGKWLYKHTEHFTIYQATVRKALVSRKTGYKGYHFTASPNVGNHSEWMGHNCEIQVKTMCEEAWDAQTHEVTYKREEAIAPDLLKHMRLLSKVLATVDEQAETVKTQIEQLELQERERKTAAAIVYFWKSTKLLKDLHARYKLTLSSNDPHRLKPEDLKALNEAIGKHYNKLGISVELCYLITLLALCHKDPKQEGFALNIATLFVESSPDDPHAEDTRGSVFWAFNHFNEAIACEEEALRKATKKKLGSQEIDIYKGNLCYWVADAATAGKKIKEQLQKKVLKFTIKLQQAYPDNSSILDTVGFVRIALGKTTTEVEEGIRLVRAARRLANRSKDLYVRRLANIFCRRHERLGFLRLARMVR